MSGNGNGERIATVEAQIENMEKRLTNVETKQDHLSKTVYMMIGGVMVLQVLSTLFLKFWPAINR